MKMLVFGLLLVAVIGGSKLSVIPRQREDPWGGLRLQQREIPESKKQDPFSIQTTSGTSSTASSTDDSKLTLDDLPVPNPDPDTALTGIALLGKFLFNDTTLSDPETITVNGQIHAGEACATCHVESAGGTISVSDVSLKFGVAPGVTAPHVGFRKVPTISYAAFTPNGLYYDNGRWRGGSMWDGRINNMFQVGAFNNPDEQGNVPTTSTNPELRQGYSKVLAEKIPNRPYADLFCQVFGSSIFSKGDEAVFTAVMKAIQAYLESDDVSPFSSDYDKVIAGKLSFTAQQLRGRNYFFREGRCGSCHSSRYTQHFKIDPKDRDLFTDFSYLNLGVPKNETNPYYESPFNPAGRSFIDVGLAGNKFPAKDGTKFYGGSKYKGRFKTPTLRNLLKFDPTDTQRVKACFHNGGLKSVREAIKFHFDRDACYSLTTNKKIYVPQKDKPPVGYVRFYQPPEVLANIYNPDSNADHTGHIDFGDKESQVLDDIMVFLEMLVDK